MGWLSNLFSDRNESPAISGRDALRAACDDLSRRMKEHADLTEAHRRYNVRDIYQLSVVHPELASDVLKSLRSICGNEISPQVCAATVAFADAVGSKHPELLSHVLQAFDEMYDRTTASSQWQMVEMAGRVGTKHGDVSVAAIRSLAKISQKSTDELIREAAVNWIGAVAGAHYTRHFSYIVNPALDSIATLRLDNSARVRKAADDWTARLHDLTDRKIIPAPK